MMARYIDADVLRDLIDGGYDIDFDELPETKEALLNMIDYQETADVRENVGGKWIEEPDEVFASTYHCSNCGFSPIINNYEEYEFSNFCPNCGADLRGDKT